jgi:hypothetical protein
MPRACSDGLRLALRAACPAVPVPEALTIGTGGQAAGGTCKRSCPARLTSPRFAACTRICPDTEHLDIPRVEPIESVDASLFWRGRGGLREDGLPKEAGLPSPDATPTVLPVVRLTRRLTAPPASPAQSTSVVARGRTGATLFCVASGPVRCDGRGAGRDLRVVEAGIAETCGRFLTNAKTCSIFAPAEMSDPRCGLPQRITPTASWACP